MDIAFEQNGWLQASALAGGANDSPHPEWHALRQRLIASQQAWRALTARQSDDEKRACGSFDGKAARLVVTFASGLHPVNLIDSANRNPGGDILVAVAGTSRTGVRGI